MPKKMVVLMLLSAVTSFGYENNFEKEKSREERTLFALKKLSEIIDLNLDKWRSLTRERMSLLSPLHEAIEEQNIPNLVAIIRKIGANSNEIKICAKNLLYFTKLLAGTAFAGLNEKVIDQDFAKNVFTTSNKIMDILLLDKEPSELKDEMTKALEILKKEKSLKAGQKLARFFIY